MAKAAQKAFGMWMEADAWAREAELRLKFNWEDWFAGGASIASIDAMVEEVRRRRSAADDLLSVAVAAAKAQE